MTKINEKLIVLEKIKELTKELTEDNSEQIVNINLDCTPETWLSQTEYANILGISSDSISERIKKGLYDKPEGKLNECFFLCAKNNSACFSVRLANEYYQINSQLAQKKKDAI